jgi:aryl-alcohol dehydrogenase-like predicted oxidoreductase
MKLGLGTAQLGMDYGVTNRHGQPPEAEALAWLRRAHERGIGLVDTAPGYGAAERVIGAALRAGCRFEVVTKIPALAAGDARAFILGALRASLGRLGTERVEGVLLHHWQDTVGSHGPAVVRALQQAKDDGLARRVGVSVYRAADIDQVLRQFTPDLVQLPVSVFDQRLAASGHLQRLSDLGVEIHARSIFMQGIALSPPENLPAHLAGLRPALEQFCMLARRNQLAPLEAALAFVAQSPYISALVVGISNAVELDALVAAFAAARSAPAVDFTSIRRQVPESLLDLDRWPSRQAAARTQ